MATLLKSGALFLHVPKTGGNWVSDVLEAQDLVFAHIGGKHAGLPQLAPFLRLLETPQRYDRANRPLFTFCFVRHPLRWYESWYRMSMSLGWPHWDADEDAWNPSVELNGLRAASFNGFIEQVLRWRPGFLTGLYDYYARDAHFVGRQEDATHNLIAILHFLDVTMDRSRILGSEPVNVSAPADIGLDPSLRNELEAVERSAFDRYGYPTSPGCSGHRPSSLFTVCGGSVPVIGPFHHDAGFAWRLDVPELSRFADDVQHARRSLLSLTEDGVPLATGHAPHKDIRWTGRGRFSHWHQSVLFATSDNSDPNRNGRRYALRWAFPGPPDRTHLMEKAVEQPFGAKT
jgi:hypothetical protein